MKYRMIFAAAAAALLLAGCAKELVETVEEADGYVIEAAATVPGSVQTKVAYTDAFKTRDDIVDIKAAWEEGDTFTALEINDEVITEVKFTAKGSGKTATFTSKGAVTATENTQWVAVFGDVTVSDGSFICKYDNQDGTLKNISKFDYAVAKATGEKPEFKFDKGTRLTYLMRILLPEGIKYIEYNTGETLEGGWSVTSAGKTKGTTSTCRKAAVKMMTLPKVSAEGDVAYLAIPAISYAIGEGTSKNRLAGLIVTIMSSDKRLSQGKVISTELSTSGGCLGTYNMSNLKLMARPLPSDAIKLGKVTADNLTFNLGNWAPFDLGGDFNYSDKDIVGGMYAWGETEPKETVTQNGYRWYNSGIYNTQIGMKYETPAEFASPCIHLSASANCSMNDGPGVYYDIRGTKYDAARVKWGSEWCMPSNEIANNIALTDGGDGKFMGSHNKEGKVEINFYAEGQYKNKWDFTSTSMGACVIKANGQELALYTTPFTDSGKSQSGSGRYYTSTSDYGVYSGTEFKGYWNRSCQIRFNTTNDIYINNKSYQWDALPIRPILNED